MATTIFPNTETETRLVKAYLFLDRAELDPAKYSPMQMTMKNNREAMENMPCSFACGA